MTDQTDQTPKEEQPGLPRIVRRHILLSWISLAAERLYPVLWPAGGVVGLFVILALANIFVYLPEWLHLVSLMGFFAALVWSVMWSLRQSSLPTHAQAVRHLEQTSGLEHRPLSTLEDRPATMADDDTRQLWRAHQRWIFNHLHKLRVGWPRLSLTARDPHALRVFMGLVIVALAVANWSDIPGRLGTALSPGIAQGRTPATFEAWVTAPAYTGETPRHLTARTSTGDETPIPVPRGSTFTVRTHSDFSAVLRVGSLGGSVPRQSRPEFVAAGGDARDAKFVIDTDMSVRLSVNASQAASWRFKVVTDTPPTIAFKGPLTVTQAQSLRISYLIKDDFGVASAEAEIALAAPKATGAAAAKPIVIDLPLPPAPAREGDAMIFKDLTDHLWAGLPVRISLVARDELNQTARTKPVTIILPERRFTQPLARALIEQRRNLARDPHSAAQVDKALQALSVAPERFMPDARIYLGLRTAAFEVHRAQLDNTHIDMARIASAQQLLWDLAVRIEAGDAPQAQAELRDIQRKLMDALAKGAPDAEIERLMAQLRAALDRAMKAMAQNAQNPNQMMQGGNGQVVTPQQLQAMLEQIQTLSRQGARAAAQQMLSQMLNLMENMNAGGGGKMSPQQQAQTQALEKLSSIMAQQRKLLDQTFREQTANEGNPAKKPSPLQGSQEKLSNDLSPVIKQAGPSDTATALKRAQDSMDEAADQLGAGKLSDAGQSQQKAIDELRRGGEAIAKQLLQQMGGQGSTIPGKPGAAGGEDEDPFGRPMASHGSSFGNSVKVPEKLDIQRAREILEELQRRAAERGRPNTELEYIERLLRRF